MAQIGSIMMASTVNYDVRRMGSIMVARMYIGMIMKIQIGSVMMVKI